MSDSASHSELTVVIDYEMGNVNAIANMVRRAGGEAVVSRERRTIQRAARLILPGVGSFDAGMRQLIRHDLIGQLEERVLEHGVPLLGICLGMQLLGISSEEGTSAGLGWLQANARRLQASEDRNLRVPHMKWSNVTIHRDGSLFSEGHGHWRFYFVHSYHCVCEDDNDVIATARHGVDFVCAVQRGNVLGTQFHPEKSHRYGLQVLSNYLRFPAAMSIR